MKASDLKSMISAIIAEELKVQIPKFLSENYIKNLVLSESKVVAAPLKEERKSTTRSIKEVMEIEESAPVQKKVKKQSSNPLLSKSNPLHELYEGVTVEEDDVKASSHGVNIDDDENEEFFERQRRHLEMLEHKTRGQIQETPEMKMRRIEHQRQMLDSRKV